MVLAGLEWMEEEQQHKLNHGRHQSTMDHGPFLGEEFTLMVGK